MLDRAIVFLCVSAAACGPGLPGDATTGEPMTSGGTSTNEAPTTGGPTIAVTTGDTATMDESTGGPGGTTEGVTDAGLCETWCANASSQDCGLAGQCLESCLGRIEYAEMMGCGVEQRGVLECEGTQVLDFQCAQASACAAEYLPFDVCYFGDCVSLGAVRLTGIGPDECTWGALFCFGHDLEMKCAATPDAQCTCNVDDVEVDACALGVDLEPDVCSDAFATFKGCCTEAFVAALQP